MQKIILRSILTKICAFVTVYSPQVKYTSLSVPDLAIGAWDWHIAELNTWWMSGHLFITFQDCPWICVKWLSSLNGERHAMPGYQPLLLFKHPNHVPNWIRRTLCQSFGLFLFTFCKNVLMLSWNLFFGYIQMVYILL